MKQNPIIFHLFAHDDLAKIISETITKLKPNDDNK